MQHFYDGQIRRYLTQTIRVLSNFVVKYGDGTLVRIPVVYGDQDRQAASIIRQNSENKINSVPRMAVYISSLDIDHSRLGDSSHVSKVHVREREINDNVYTTGQGRNYTVERLMPTPFKLTLKCDIWTANTDQKLQVLEQLLVLFNPSLELQTTDNYIDWTSISSLYLSTTTFSSRSIPVGAESEIDVCSLEFELPVWLSPPAKVKKLGIVQSVISNVFMESGDVANIDDIIYNSYSLNRRKSSFDTTTNRFRVLLFKSNTGNLSDHQYDLTLVNPDAAVLAVGLDQKDYKNGEPVEWDAILEVQGGYVPGSQVWFKKPDGSEIRGTFVINPLDRSILTVTLDSDTYPGNYDVNSSIAGIASRGTVDAIIDPHKFNPIETFGAYTNFPLGIRYLMLDDVNNSNNRGGFNRLMDGADSSKDPYRGPEGWKDAHDTDPVIAANSIVEWDGVTWTTIWNPDEGELDTVIQNIRTGIKYRWDGTQWLKAFEGEYGPSQWNFKLI